MGRVGPGTCCVDLMRFGCDNAFELTFLDEVCLKSAIPANTVMRSSPFAAHVTTVYSHAIEHISMDAINKATVGIRGFGSLRSVPSHHKPSNQ